MKAMYNAKLAPLLAQQEEAQDELSDAETEEPVPSVKKKVIPFILTYSLHPKTTPIVGHLLYSPRPFLFPPSRTELRSSSWRNEQDARAYLSLG